MAMAIGQTPEAICTSSLHGRMEGFDKDHLGDVCFVQPYRVVVLHSSMPTLAVVAPHRRADIICQRLGFTVAPVAR